MHLRAHHFAALRPAALALLALSLGSLGCDAILGIHDVQRDPTGGAGGAGAAGGGAAGGTGGSSGTMASVGGAGGAMGGDFDFAATSPNADLPISGQSFLGVQIAPKNGFFADVDISIKLPPSDVTFEGTTLIADTTTGAVKLGAKASATLGQMFDITLVAKSGAISHEITVKGIVTGTPGTLVDNFGVGGVASWTLAMDDGNVFDVREVAQNKILTTGDNLPALASFLKGARILPSGMMDAGFGPAGDGTVTAQFCGCTKSSEGRGVARLLNGNVLMVGTGNKGSGFTDDIAIQRYKDNGAVDDIGQDKGQALVDLGGIEMTYAMELTKDEHILAVGSTSGKGFVAKLDTFGNLDTSFAGTGFIVVSSLAAITSLALDSQQRIVLAGIDGAADLEVNRLLADGTADPAFNGGVAFVYAGAGQQRPVGVAIDQNGKIVIAGTTEENGSADVLVIRLKDDGTVDNTFGKSGVTVAALSADSDDVADMAVLTDNRVVVAGNNLSGPFVGRFLKDGTPDPTFGNSGFVSIFLGMNGVVESMTIAQLGRILLAGKRENQPTKGFVAKIWN